MSNIESETALTIPDVFTKSGSTQVPLQIPRPHNAESDAQRAGRSADIL